MVILYVAVGVIVVGAALIYFFVAIDSWAQMSSRLSDIENRESSLEADAEDDDDWLDFDE